MQWFIFHTSSNKTSCENSCRCNPYHWSCKAKPELPAHWVFDVSAVSSRCWNVSPPACRAEESPAPMRAAHNRLSTLVMLSLLPSQLFVFRSSWITFFLSAVSQTLKQEISMQPGIHTHTRTHTHSVTFPTLTHNVILLKAWICVLSCMSCYRWIKKPQDKGNTVFSRVPVSDFLKSHLSEGFKCLRAPVLTVTLQSVFAVNLQTLVLKKLWVHCSLQRFKASRYLWMYLQMNHFCVWNFNNTICMLQLLTW